MFPAGLRSHHVRLSCLRPVTTECEEWCHHAAGHRPSLSLQWRWSRVIWYCLMFQTPQSCYEWPDWLPLTTCHKTEADRKQNINLLTMEHGIVWTEKHWPVSGLYHDLELWWEGRWRGETEIDELLMFIIILKSLEYHFISTLCGLGLMSNGITTPG